MSHTIVMRTTGWERSEMDEGYELFVVTLDSEEIQRLLRLIDSAKHFRNEPGFRFIELHFDGECYWLALTELPQKIADCIKEAAEADNDIIVSVDANLDISRHSDPPTTFMCVNAGGVIFSCNVGKNWDWLIDSIEISESKLREMVA